VSSGVSIWDRPADWRRLAALRQPTKAKRTCRKTRRQAPGLYSFCQRYENRQRAPRLVFLRRRTVVLRLDRAAALRGRRAALRFLRVLRAGLSMLRRAVFSAARLIAGDDRESLARPAASAALVFSSTTSVAAFAAAPMASPATSFTFLAPRFAA
jgi:hypothetical protein